VRRSNLVRLFGVSYGTFLLLCICSVLLNMTAERNPDSAFKPVKYLSKKALFERRNTRRVPELREEDIEETFIRGSGTGGQAINKTRSNVSLLHKPTGIRMNCQETRSLHRNRQLARRMLLERLDQAENPGLSKLDMRILLERRRKDNRAKKVRKKLARVKENSLLSVPTSCQTREYSQVEKKALIRY